MCGISGFVLRERNYPEPELNKRLWAMVTTLRHRGPDHQAIWTDGVAGLGHDRLSIIDLSPSANQPMFSADGKVAVVFNGEIYNFLDLRRELEAAGYIFKTRSDTETIIYGYKAWGGDVFKRLRGMFAIAIWDRGERRLVLARDRVGKKPLYYARMRDAFVFGSEIKALLTWPTVERRPDLTAIDQYLTFQYVPSPRTAFAGISKLPPAHYMELEVSAGGILSDARLTRYWALPKPRQAQRRQPLAGLQEELIDRLREAVKVRLISDVPLGAFLSGGVDSSAIVAMMATLGGGTVKTFSIGFGEAKYDERHYARMVAERYATDHEELVVQPDAVSILPKLVWHYGEPFADPSAIPTYYVSELARRKVTVALNGDGGDENFFGYDRYPAVQSLPQFSGIPAPLRRLAAAALKRKPSWLPNGHQQRLSRLEALLDEVSRPSSQRYAFTIAYFMDSDKRLGYADALSDATDASALDLLEPYFAEADTMTTGAHWADLHTYLPDDLMVKVDVASMAHSLESRSPFLDHELMEWAATIPEDVHIPGGETKMLLKRALEPYLPREVLYRKKMGFGCPVDVWLRGEMKELAYDTLLSERFRSRGLFRPDYVQELLDSHCSGAADHHTRLWAMLMLELWFSAWIDVPVEAAIQTPAA